MIRVFISHSTHDRMAAERLVELLRSALRLSAAEVRCTSVTACKLPAWAEVDETLRSEIMEADIFLALITPASLASRAVSLELGARWGAKKEIVHMVSPDVDSSVLEALRGPVTPVDFTTETEIRQLIAQIAERLKLCIEQPAAYDTCIKQFVNAVLEAASLRGMTDSATDRHRTAIPAKTRASRQTTSAHRLPSIRAIGCPEFAGCPLYTAPSSVFLSGEHAVMFGHAAVYLPLPMRLYVRIEKDDRVPDISFGHFLIPDPDQPDIKRPIVECQHYRREIGREEEQRLRSLFTEVILPFVPSRTNGVGSGFRIHIDSDFPVACGLDASGAIAACLSRAFVDCLMDLDSFRSGMDLPEVSKERIVLLLAWLIENCFHSGKGSGAGVAAAVAGRCGRHPLVYFPAKRSLLLHRTMAGWDPVDVGDGKNGLHRLAGLPTYTFDPSIDDAKAPAYGPPPPYHVSLVYSGNPSKTGEVLQGHLRQVCPHHGKRVNAVQQAVKDAIGFDRLSRAVRFHAEEVIEKIYLNADLPLKLRNMELETAYHELLCESMGGVSISMMNSVLFDWRFVPELMDAYQSLLNIAGASNPRIEMIRTRLGNEILDRRLTRSVGSKITGCGRGGDIVVVTVNQPSEVHDELVNCVAGQLNAPVHFRSSECQEQNWQQVPGVHREE